jgi:hypothetical protein
MTAWNYRDRCCHSEHNTGHTALGCPALTPPFRGRAPPRGDALGSCLRGGVQDELWQGGEDGRVVVWEMGPWTVWALWGLGVGVVQSCA